MSNIILTEIKNSNTITHIGYDAIEKKLQVVYRTTGLYEYYDIPESDFRALAKTVASDFESVGKHVRRIIRGKQFVYLNQNTTI